MSAFAIQTASAHLFASSAALSEGAAPYVIKNTFIEVADAFDALPEQRRRRTASAPPATMRDSKLPQGDVRHVQLDIMLNSGSLPKASSIASVSTLDDLEEAASSTDVATSEDSSDTMSVCAPSLLQLADLVPPPPRPSRLKLSSKAKAWAPGGSLRSIGLPLEVRRCFAEVVAAGNIALRSSTLGHQAEVCENFSGSWSLAASFQPQHLDAARCALRQAQDAMLRAAERSAHVYFVGYEAQPFSVDSSGLCVRGQLAMVQDENSACWDLLAGGRCCRGAHCRWRHPAWLASVDMSLRPDPQTLWQRV
mmetsp:Transcript_33177/g.91426  ORF Transcript_33177/g.91426 Transcript_33177/m.91426 type:complete len:308 (-) Transcript_33177:60-983(-)